MRFVKMHGLGNDFVVVRAESERGIRHPGPPAVRAICDRHTGVGADGLLWLSDDSECDFRMVVFNADGSDGGMCGNGLRCASLLLFETGAIGSKASARVSSRVVSIEIDAGRAGPVAVRTTLGRPAWAPAEIPTSLRPTVEADGAPRILDADLDLREGAVGAGRSVLVSCVSVGNPHAVVFVPRVEQVDVRALGPVIEAHPAFPERTNVQFVERGSGRGLRLRTWERGVGETASCASGAAAAAVVASVLAGSASDGGSTARGIRVVLPGGALEVVWDGEGEPVSVVGPACRVFEGEWPSERLSDPGHEPGPRAR